MIFSTCLALIQAQLIERGVSKAEEARAACAQGSLDEPCSTSYARTTTYLSWDGQQLDGKVYSKLYNCTSDSASVQRTLHVYIELYKCTSNSTTAHLTLQLQI